MPAAATQLPILTIMLDVQTLASGALQLMYEFILFRSGRRLSIV
jgi:hypothetical protein